VSAWACDAGGGEAGRQEGDGGHSRGQPRWL